MAKLFPCDCTYECKHFCSIESDIDEYTYICDLLNFKITTPDNKTKVCPLNIKKKESIQYND